MKDLYIESTASTPLVDFRNSGKIKLEGRALPEDSRKFFNPLFQWIEEFGEENLIFDVNLYYFNTAVSKQLHEMFRMIDGKESLKNITINWYYEEGDDEALESGELYESFLKRATFNYIEYAEQL